MIFEFSDKWYLQYHEYDTRYNRPHVLLQIFHFGEDEICSLAVIKMNLPRAKPQSIVISDKGKFKVSKPHSEKMTEPKLGVYKAQSHRTQRLRNKIKGDIA